MISKRIFQFLVAATLVVAWLVPFAFSGAPAIAHPPLDATPVGSDLMNPKFLKDPCPADPNNLLQNAAMDPDGSSPYGSVANSWTPFIFSGNPPQFRWVNNEGIYRGQSQQIVSTSQFDAGILQTVSNLNPGEYYWFRLGWTPAAKSFSGPNVDSPSVGRKVGYDPYGGTDPHSPNVVWGPDFFGDIKGLNRPQMILFFPARASSVTIFLRAIATDGSGGENRVWFNAPCMEARPDLPTATPLAPTATPTAPATATRLLPTRAPVTKIALAPSSPTPTEPVTLVPDTATPTVETLVAALPATTPRYARPDVTPAPGSPIDLGQGALAGTGVILVVGGLIFFGLGILLWRRNG